jgi:hypothetical protein
VISTFMADYFLFTRTILAVGLVAAVVVAFLLPRAGKWGRIVATAIAAVAGILVLALTFSPDPTGVLDEAQCNLEPHSFAFDVLNMALFLLPALFAVVAARRPAVVALAVPVASALIELVQFLTPVLGRRCDVDDLLANVIGGLLGVLIGAVALRLARRVPAKR